MDSNTISFALLIAGMAASFYTGYRVGQSKTTVTNIRTESLTVIGNGTNNFQRSSVDPTEMEIE